MPLTREFKETVQARIKQDRKYRKELLREGVESLLTGDLDTGKAILRDYINATIGFEELGMHRIIGQLWAANTASAKLLQRLGLRLEAHFVKAELHEGIVKYDAE